MTLEQRYLTAKRALFDKAYASLNREQREAVFTVNGPLLVLAGAGSGKTTVLVKRIAFLIRYGNAYATDYIPFGLDESCVTELEALTARSAEEILPYLDRFASSACPPWRVLAITFTNKAADEIKNRLATVLADIPDVGEIWSGTFHAVCMRILRTHAEKLGYAQGLSIYDTDDTKKAVSAAMKACNVDEKAFPVKSVMNAISRAKDKLQTPDDFEKDAGGDYRLQTIAKVYHLYAQQLRASNALDFDDIIMQTVFLLERNPDVLEQYQSRFRYVSVDEYQDTNVAQFRLTQLLAGGSRNLMVVGDDDQSIYRFRGATVENILHFDRSYPDAVVIKLEQNYRSTANILNAANAVIAHNDGRKGKNLWTAGDTGSKIHITEVEDQNAEARYIVNVVQKEVAAARATYRDFAVLYRTNAQANSIERAFAKSAVPYRTIGGMRFSDRKEIRDAVAYLQLVFNHADRERLLRIINEPKRKIGDKTLEAVEQIAGEQGISLLEVMRFSESYPALARTATILKGFADLIEELTALLPTMPLDAFFDEVLVRSGYRQMLVDGGEPEKDRLDNLDEFKSAIVEYCTSVETPTLGGFLEENALVADVDRYDETADAVVMMTIHSAKGLEFPNVFLPGMEDGLFPGMQTIMASHTEMEEERRLAYVAITRAKKSLYLVHAKTRLMFGRTTLNPVSRFVEEIPQELLEKQNLTSDAFASGLSTTGGYAGGMYGTGKGTKVYYSDPYAGRTQKTLTPPDTGRVKVGQPLMKDGKHLGGKPLFAEGDRVKHMTFGEGIILSVKPVGADTLYEIVFDRVGTKRLMATYAKLQKID